MDQKSPISYFFLQSLVFNFLLACCLSLFWCLLVPGLFPSLFPLNFNSNTCHHIFVLWILITWPYYFNLFSFSSINTRKCWIASYLKILFLVLVFPSFFKIFISQYQCGFIARHQRSKNKVTLQHQELLPFKQLNQCIFIIFLLLLVGWDWVPRYCSSP
jgi:hypothetical protein